MDKQKALQIVQDMGPVRGSNKITRGPKEFSMPDHVHPNSRVGRRLGPILRSLGKLKWHERMVVLDTLVELWRKERKLPPRADTSSAGRQRNEHGQFQ
jgi:hypothetical protein